MTFDHSQTNSSYASFPYFATATDWTKRFLLFSQDVRAKYEKTVEMLQDQQRLVETLEGELERGTGSRAPMHPATTAAQSHFSHDSQLLALLGDCASNLEPCEGILSNLLLYCRQS